MSPTDSASGQVYSEGLAPHDPTSSSGILVVGLSVLPVVGLCPCDKTEVDPCASVRGTRVCVLGPNVLMRH